MHIIARIYEIVVLLIVLGCLRQILWGTPTYDAQLSELQTAMNTNWQQSQKQAFELINDFKESVIIRNNTAQNWESVRKGQQLVHKTKQINNALEHIKTHGQNNQQALSSLEQTVSKYHQWLQRTFKNLQLPLLDSLTKYPEVGGATPAVVRALVTTKQLQLQQVQKMVLRALLIVCPSGEIKCCFGCQRVYITPKSQLVQVGDEYRASLYYGQPVDGESIKRSSSPHLQYRKGVVSFTQKNRGKQYWEAKFRYYTYNGKDTTVVHKIYYEALPKGK
ncbi:hypothetical protein [Microscilla marina]|uniref:Uncharacterized protein n=1 Tax=Microscilla marina ATCC 23134 TaxID=313606 RepID=A1ZLB1_MICM2|nr:hypothetical protein [Microscilla marina]EAY28665.1 hypothetical protein M23134_07763 [Microscilla marina ATCC 23134]